MTKQPSAKVRVFVLRIDIARELISGQEIVHLLNRKIGLWVRGVFWLNSSACADGRSFAWKDPHSDLAIITFRHLDLRRQILRYRFGELDFAATRHAHEQ